MRYSVRTGGETKRNEKESHVPMVQRRNGDVYFETARFRYVCLGDVFEQTAGVRSFLFSRVDAEVIRTLERIPCDKDSHILLLQYACQPKATTYDLPSRIDGRLMTRSFEVDRDGFIQIVKGTKTSSNSGLRLYSRVIVGGYHGN